jgi:hypothetical protein
MIFSSEFEEQGGKRRQHDLYLSTLSRSRQFGSISPPSFSCFPLLLPLLVFFFFFFFIFCQFLPTRSSPFSFPLNSYSAFIHDLNSLTCSRGILCWFWFEFSLGRRWKRETCNCSKLTLGRGRVTFSLSLPLHLYFT